MYIHKTVCISPQHTFSEINLEEVVDSVDNKLHIIEPKIANIPLNTLRRMGKAVRMGVAAAITLIKDIPELNGIIIGTANGGMDDCIKFLNQIIEFEEGTLTPKNFVQSTTNAIAAQIALTANNFGYNITHVHRGLAFENALLDTWMLIKENPERVYLTGGGDEISTYNFNLENARGWYKEAITSNLDLYQTNTKGSIAGEGVAMFIASGKKEGAIAKLKALKLLHTDDALEVQEQLQLFLKENLHPDKKVDIFLTGENGDNRFDHFYFSCEQLLEKISVARFKHLCGEYPTASSFALWLSCYLLNSKVIPVNVLKTAVNKNSINTILIYNNCKGVQHGFMLVEKIN